MTPNSATNKLTSATQNNGTQVAVASGNTVTASVWIRKDGSYLTSQPRLIVRSNPAVGITVDTVLATMSDVSDGTIPTFFDVATVSTVSLSSDCLTATHTSSGFNAGARSAVFYTTGKYYFEIMIGIAGGSPTWGAITPSGTYNDMSTSATNCIIVAPSGTIYSNGGNQTKSVGAVSVGNVVGFALDLTARKGWIRRNGGNWNGEVIGISNPATGAGGVPLYATVGYAPAVCFWAGSAGDNSTLNAGQTAYVAAAPSGFGNWTNPAGAVGSATWVELSGTTIAATDDGVMEFIVDCDGTSGFINVDDWEFSTTETAPVNTVVPVISGITGVGGTLTTTIGTWTATPATIYIYQWKRDGSNISGATASTYMLISADLAATITVMVTATNAVGSANATSIGVGPIRSSVETASFLTRTTGLDTTHINAYTALIDGLVADGLWTKFDILHIYATQNATTANLNLVSTSYPATVNGSPTFTADRGYTGVNASTTDYINLGFKPSTAPSPILTVNSAHISCWNLTNTTSTGAALGANTSLTSACIIYPKYTDNNAYFRINGSNTSGDVAISDPRGHLIGSRTASNLVTGYQNGSSIMTLGQTSAGVMNFTYYALTSNQTDVASGGAWELAMISVGSGLTGANATSFYNRLRTYMTTMGVP